MYTISTLDFMYLDSLCLLICSIYFTLTTKINVHLHVHLYIYVYMYM